jgi:subtilisin-like proprotein convertase family protein
MLSYFERAFEGLEGIVTSTVSGQPLEAEIRLDANPFPSYTDPDVGDYHRIVLPGTYNVEVSAEGFMTRVIDGVEVLSGDATRLDVALEPEPAALQPMNSRVEDGVGGNGRLEAGETADLAVTLQNLGAPATSVGAMLRPISWYADVTRPEALYPDIPTAGSGESLPPHHEVSVDASVPLGHQAGFFLDWESDQGRGRTEAFFIGVGDADCETLHATDVPQPLTYIKSPLSEIQAPESEVFSLRVSVDIRHTYIGDLLAVLRAPSGSSVVLHDQSGGATDDIVGTYPDDLTPAEPLTALLGHQPAGPWRLTITDSTLPDVGSLEGWSIEICGYPSGSTRECGPTASIVPPTLPPRRHSWT